jgi:protein-S-isoprenylcysteine O-methyltransferase Ste14
MAANDPRKFPFPPAIPIVGLLASWGLQEVWPIALDWPEWTFWVGLVLFVAPFALVAWAQLTFRRHGTVVDPRGDVAAIVDDGPFRYTRNPMYLSLLVSFFGGSLLFRLPWAWPLLIVVFLALHFGIVLPEEQYLEGTFGDAYRRYRERVRRWL